MQNVKSGRNFTFTPKQKCSPYENDEIHSQRRETEPHHL